MLSAFHVNVPDVAEYTCRLVRKARSQGLHIVIVGPQPLLDAVDQLMWTLGPQSFIPHASVSAPEVVSQRSPVRLMQTLETSVKADVLINLGRELPAGFASFGRMVDVVSAEEAERLAARTRWKQLVTAGYTPELHDAAAVVRA